MKNRDSRPWYVSRRLELPLRPAVASLDRLVQQRSLVGPSGSSHSTLEHAVLMVPPRSGVPRQLVARLHLEDWALPVPVEIELVGWSHSSSELGLRPKRRLPAEWRTRRYFECASHLLEVLTAEISAGQVPDGLGVRPSHEREPARRLAAVLFTDIVDSTRTAAAVGDQRWRQILDLHDSVVADTIEQHRGQLVKQTGDGVLATFDGPARTIACARAIGDRLHPVGVSVRAGIHAGEIDFRGDDVGGLTVNIAARVTSHAGPDEVVVSSTVRDLVAGSDINFEDRGVHHLRGAPEGLRLLAVAS